MNHVEAYIEDSIVTSMTDEVEVFARSAVDFQAVVVGVALATGSYMPAVKGFGFTIGGSLALGWLESTIGAHISGGATVQAATGVGVEAVDDSSILNVAGSVGIATGFDLKNKGAKAVGAAVSVNYVENEVDAFIDSSLVSSAGDVKVEARSEASPFALALGGAGATGFALEGSFAVNVVACDVEATIGGSGAVTAGGSVLVSAFDDLDLQAIAGSFALSTGATGSAVGIASATRRVRAESNGVDVIARAEPTGSCSTRPRRRRTRGRPGHR